MPEEGVTHRVILDVPVCVNQLEALFLRRIASWSFVSTIWVTSPIDLG